MGPMDVYTDQEANRLSQIMVNDPHAAANELRNQLVQLDPQTASVLIAKTKNDEYVGGLGDLQIQVERDQMGYDTGYRNVTMASQYGVEQVAEIQANVPGYGQPGYNAMYANNPLGYAAGIMVGDLGFQLSLGLNIGDPRYQGWCNREQYRENYWGQNNGAFAANWANPAFRNGYQEQNWQTTAFQPTQNTTYMPSTTYNSSMVNKPVNITEVNQTVNNTRNTYNTTNQTFNQTINKYPQETGVHYVPTASAPAEQKYTGPALQQRHEGTMGTAQTAAPAPIEHAPIARPAAGANQPGRLPGATAQPIESAPAGGQPNQRKPPELHQGLPPGTSREQSPGAPANIERPASAAQPGAGREQIKAAPPKVIEHPAAAAQPVERKQAAPPPAAAHPIVQQRTEAAPAARPAAAPAHEAVDPKKK